MFVCRLSRDVIFNLLRFKLKICHFSKTSFNDLTVRELLCRSVVLSLVLCRFYSGNRRPLVIRTAAPVCLHPQRLDGAEEKTEKLNLYVNCTDALRKRKKKKVLLRVCGRVGGAVCVWGCRGNDTCSGLENETRRR